MSIYQKLVLKLLAAILTQLVYRLDGDININDRHERLIQETQNIIGKD